MRTAIAVIIGFVHDASTGCWAATVLAVWWLHRTGIPPEAAADVHALMRQFFWIGIVCAIVVMATGAGRTFTYVNGVYGADAERLRRRALLIKHLVLVAVFGTGIAWQWSVVFR